MARNFNGATDFLTSTSAPLTAVPLSIACWINPNAIGTSGGIMSIDDGGSSATVDGWNLNLNATGNIVFNAITSGTGGTATTTTTTTTSGVWAHACGTCVTSSQRSVYLNGGNIGHTSSTKTPLGVSRAVVGRTQPGGATAQLFNGLIAEVAVWSVGLTDAEVAILGNTTNPMSPILMHPESLIFYAPLLSGNSPEIEMKGPRVLSLTGTPTVASHGRTFYPSEHKKFRFGQTTVITIDQWFTRAEIPVDHVMKSEIIGY